MISTIVHIFKTSTISLILMLPIISIAQINVDDAPYNAVGDGVTDDTDAIQAALTDFRTMGGTLTFTSNKTYIISSGLILHYYLESLDYLVTTTGPEKATIKIQDGLPITYGNWGIRINNSPNVTLKNLKIDGNRATRNPTIETPGVYSIIVNGPSNGTRLIDLELINSVMDNVYIVTYDDEEIMTDFEMHNCILKNAFRNNMSVISGANFNIIGCEFINANGTLPMAGIDFEPDPASPPYSNMTIEGCLFKDNLNYGLMLTHIVDNTGTSTIKNNLFDNNGLLIASKDNNIHHNIFVNQDYNHIDGNGNPLDGIVYFHTDWTPTGNIVHDNYFYDNPMPAGSHLVNFMYNTGGGNTVEDNYAFNNIVDGFVINNTNPATNPPQIIINNTFLNNREMGYWNMDNAETNANTINDLSDFNHDGTIVGATSIPGVINEAMDFAPDNKYIEIPANNNLDIEMNITLMAWVKWAGVNALEPEQVIIGRDNNWKLGVSDVGELQFYAPAPYTADWTKSTANSIPANQWKFIAITYNGRYTKLYIDGVEVASEQANGALGTSFAKIFIGSSNTNTHSFNGAIDDVRIYNYSMEQTDIEAIYNAAPLSVEWIEPLVANIYKDLDVLLEWSVAQQKDNAYFIIEHSLDGTHFKSIQKIKGDGNLSQVKKLKYIHTNANMGVNYYRIKQVDFDGNTNYSNIANAVLSRPSISIIPNPATNYLFISGIANIDKIEVYNQIGEKLLQLEDSNQIDINSLTPGIYLVQIQSRGNKYVQKIVKE